MSDIIIREVRIFFYGAYLAFDLGFDYQVVKDVWTFSRSDKAELT
jgi:hypothetical protein